MRGEKKLKKLSGGMNQMDYKEFAFSKYNELFESNYNCILGGKTSDNAKTQAERDAQHIAMLETFKEGYLNYADVANAAQIWNAIYSVHLKRKAGLQDLNELDENIINKIISGAQSWKKCSGHVFEHFVVEYTRERLKRYNIRFILQKDLTILLKEHRLMNENDDMIHQMARSEDFDIYAIIDINGNNLVFGCIQAKTSIRDRVGRDRDFSIPVMEKHFWSPAVVLDGAYLAMPKFEHMVNGGGEAQYEQNGWHGMYVMSNIRSNRRIYYDKNLDLLIEHANLAAQKFISSRQRFDRNWKADE